LKQLIESVYSKLNLVNTFCESDADILTILNGAPQQAVLPAPVQITSLP
jgi:hypothetical protein